MLLPKVGPIRRFISTTPQNDRGALFEGPLNRRNLLNMLIGSAG